jgi:hypothetical protein
MADFQAAYDQTTNDINNTLSTQLSSVLTWANIPGTLVKVTSSASGYAWGYNGTFEVFSCQLPCTGNWQPTDLSKFSIGIVHDIVSDDTNVYILVTSTDGKVNMLTNTADNRGVWNMIPVPFAPSRLFSTHSYIWAQDPQNNKQKCPKPCTSSNWLAEPENRVTITSSSATSLYGKDPSGNGVKSDETLQSGWLPITGLLGTKLNAVVGDLDKSAIFTVDPTFKVSRCEGDCSAANISPVDTKGFTPLNLTADTTTKTLWMTSTTPGDVGNVFKRPDKPDYSTIMNTITPLDKQRDAVIGDIAKSYTQQTGVMVVNKQVSDIESIFKNMFAKTHKTSAETKNALGKLQKVISEQQGTLDQITSIEPLLMGFVLTLLAVVIIYFVGSFLGGLIHLVALAVLAVGIYLTINNGFSGSSMWSRLFETA